MLSTRKIVIRRQELGVGVVLFTTALGLYGGVLWSGELQGFIIHERVPSATTALHHWPVTWLYLT